MSANTSAPKFLSKTRESVNCEAVFINTLQVVQMAKEEVPMTPDMKVMYKAFVTQFQKLNSRLDDMD